MSDNPPTPGGDKYLVCTTCGHVKEHHYLVNFSDGPLVGSTVLICPTAVFTVERSHDE